MKILEFLNSHLDDWEEILTQEPYYIKVKRDGEYILLSYSQLNSDFTNPIVRECRGSIFKKVNGQFKCVCMPFYKFANYGESYADTINWSAAAVYEKIDGSLMKVWYDDGEWHVSTNNTINAYKAMISNYPEKSFGDIFEEALGETNINQFFKTLNTKYCYMFELVSPYIRVVIPYAETALYYLTARNMISFTECHQVNAIPFFKYMGIKFPSCFNLSTLEQCINFANSLDKNHEGFVVVDDMGHRVKVKGSEYLIAAHAANNGVMGLSTALDLIRRNAIDDFTSYCDIHNQYIQMIVDCVNNIMIEINNQWIAASKLLQDGLTPGLAVFIRSNFEYSDYIFKKYRDLSLNPFEYLFFRIYNSSLCHIVHSELIKKEIKKKEERYNVSK